MAERRARRLLRNRTAIDRRPYEEKCGGERAEIETAGMMGRAGIELRTSKTPAGFQRYGLLGTMRGLGQEIE